jgi:hypothetical protein
LATPGYGGGEELKGHITVTLQQSREFIRRREVELFFITKTRKSESAKDQRMAEESPFFGISSLRVFVKKNGTATQD